MQYKRLINIVLFLIFSVSRLSTFSQVDSLELKLNYVEGDEKFELLLDISREYWYIDPLKSVDFAKEAFDFGYKNTDEIKKARALNRMANGYYFLEQYKLALEYYIKSLELSENSNYLSGIAKACNNIGLIYNDLGDYDMALEYYMRSLEIEKQESNYIGIANTSLNLGNIYYYLGNFQKALLLYFKCLNIYQETKDKDGILDTYNNMGSTYSELNQPDSALYYYDKTYQLSIEYGNQDIQASSMNNLGTVYFDMKDYSKALEYYNSALKLEIGQEDLWSEANTIRNIGGVYLMMGDNEKAILYFNEAGKIAEKISANRLLMDIYYDVSGYYNEKRNFRKAYEYHTLATDIKDSIYNEESSRQIAEVEAKYAFRNKDQQLQIITKENKLKNLKIKTQRYIIYIVTSLSLLILALVFVFYSRSKANKTATKIQKEKNTKITEQKILLEKALSELKESDEKHVSLINNIQDGIFVLQDEKIRFANDSFSKIAGYSLDDIYDMDYTMIIHPDDLDMIVSNYERRLAGENLPSSYEFKIINKKGETVNLMISAGIINFLGKPAHIGTIKNITQLKTHETELIKEKEKAEEATQSKSMFLAGMSHEIRNHMSSIIGITEVLSETKLSKEQNEYVDVINASGNNLLNIINEILDFSKIEARQVILEAIEFNIRQLVDEVISMHELKTKQRKLFLKSEVDASIPEIIIGDPSRITQILINLVNNAIKFTDEGGITIKVGVDIKKHIGNRPESTPCLMKFEVIDTGIGISKDSQNKLFKPFSQTHAAVQRKQGGTGLGLAICKQLVELMEGEIGITSAVGKGSNFWFTARLTNPNDDMTSSEKKDSGKKTEKKNLKVLIVEDNVLNQQLTMNILVKEGYNTDVAENGKIGLELYKKNGYDVILMDIQMPIMDGIQATRMIRNYERTKNKKRSNIIAVTAHSKEGEQQRLFNAGMDHYISKPFKSDELLKVIKNLDLS